MRKYLLVLLVLLFSLTLCESNSDEIKVKKKLDIESCESELADYCVKVVSISDGDTFRGITKNNEEIKFRIYGIDAPEKSQAFGNKAKAYLSDLIFGEIVGIKVRNTDFFKREVVWVYTSNGEDVSAKMLEAGMAWHFKKYDKSERYARLEEKARQNHVGLWQDKNPTPPWQFRRDEKNKKKRKK